MWRGCAQGAIANADSDGRLDRRAAPRRLRHERPPLQRPVRAARRRAPFAFSVSRCVPPAHLMAPAVVPAVPALARARASPAVVSFFWRRQTACNGQQRAWRALAGAARSCCESQSRSAAAAPRGIACLRAHGAHGARAHQRTGAGDASLALRPELLPPVVRRLSAFTGGCTHGQLGCVAELQPSVRVLCGAVGDDGARLVVVCHRAYRRTRSPQVGWQPTQTRTHAHTHARTHARTDTQTRTHVLTYTHTHARTRTHARTHTCVCTCLWTRTGRS